MSVPGQRSAPTGQELRLSSLAVSESLGQPAGEPQRNRPWLACPGAFDFSLWEVVPCPWEIAFPDYAPWGLQSFHSPYLRVWGGSLEHASGWRASLGQTWSFPGNKVPQETPKSICL